VVGQHIAHVEHRHQRLSAGDDARVASFIRQHVERFVGHLDAATDEILLCQRPTQRLYLGPDAERLIEAYRSAHPRA